jgi:hypothetical protein
MSLLQDLGIKVGESCFNLTLGALSPLCDDMDKTLLVLLTELEKPEFLVAIDGVSELESDEAPSKLGTLRMVDSIFGLPFGG